MKTYNELRALVAEKKQRKAISQIYSRRKEIRKGKNIPLYMDDFHILSIGRQGYRAIKREQSYKCGSICKIPFIEKYLSLSPTLLGIRDISHFYPKEMEPKRIISHFEKGLISRI